MDTRSTRSMVTFSRPFSLAGYSGELPAGDYEVIVEEVLLEGLSFLAWRRTATYLTASGKNGKGGRSQTRRTTDRELQEALIRDRSHPLKDDASEEARSS